jgi:hypothetical protein
VKLRVGQTLASTVDAVTVIVVRAPDGDVTITNGGAEMVDPKGDRAGEKGTADPAQQGGTQLGKRYVDAADTIELLATKGGPGSLAIDGAPLEIKSAKPLPASD